MALLTQPSFTAKASLIYITLGALLDVWTSVWYFSFRDPIHPMEKSTLFWLSGFFVMGLILMLIGFLMGPLGRYARKAELPPTEAVNAEANIQQAAASTPVTVVPLATETVPGAGSQSQNSVGIAAR